MTKILGLIMSLCLAATTFASPNHEHPAPKLSKNFEDMKALVGTWEGTGNMGGKDQQITVTYELTSGGTALVEKLMPGTPHEMVTVYANNGNSVNMTHYCALGNQPQMKLKKSEKSMFSFEMDGTKGITNKNEMHMHAVNLTINGNKLKQEWTNYKDNKQSEIAVFEFTKKN